MKDAYTMYVSTITTIQLLILNKFSIMNFTIYIVCAAYFSFPTPNVHRHAFVAPSDEKSICRIPN